MAPVDIPKLFATPQSQKRPLEQSPFQTQVPIPAQSGAEILWLTPHALAVQDEMDHEQARDPPGYFYFDWRITEVDTATASRM